MTLLVKQLPSARVMILESLQSPADLFSIILSLSQTNKNSRGGAAGRLSILLRCFFLNFYFFSCGSSFLSGSGLITAEFPLKGGRGEAGF